ncbi:MAG: hypothetical protein IKQ60_08815 [Candidatus Methanomethylophilaceae archaeon]|nr:hypothetical protein [Candidatus Methanomethylophilaceae archaeon]
MTVANLIRNSSSLSMYDRTKPHSASFSSGFGFHVEQKESQTDQLSISGTKSSYRRSLSSRGTSAYAMTIPLRM